MRMTRTFLRCACVVALLASGCGDPDGLRLPHNGDSVVGAARTLRLDEPVKAIDLAQRYSVALDDLLKVNARVRRTRDGHLPAGAEVKLPTQFVLPDVPRRGIVINIAERRLYWFPGDPDDKADRVLVFAAAVGREEWETPTGQTHVAERIVDPPWYPPESIRAEAAESGTPLPEVVPPGPENPLGRHALRLGWKKHLIHGTNAPKSIGQRVSHGCVRLYPEDMEQLFEHVREGTPVRLVDQAVKLGTHEGALYLEAHPPQSPAGEEQQEGARRKIEAWARKHPGRRIDWDRVKRALAEPTGLPVRISAS